MTKSEYPNGPADHYAQPGQPHHPGQNQGQNQGQGPAAGQPAEEGYGAVPSQMDQTYRQPVAAVPSAMDPPQMAPGQPSPQGHYPPQGGEASQGQFVPRMSAEASPAAQGDYFPQEAGNNPPAANAPLDGQYDPAYGNNPPSGHPQNPSHASAQDPVDDYLYPQGQGGLPDVPDIAVPPSADYGTEPAAHHGYSPQTSASPDQQEPAGLQGQGQAGGGAAPAALTGAGEQISQRLAQLQSQYDGELAGESGNFGLNARENHTSQTTGEAETYSAPQAPVDEFSGLPPSLAPEQPQQQAFHAGPPPTHEAYHDGQPQQAAQYVTPPMAPTPAASFADPGLASDPRSALYRETGAGGSALPSIAQEATSGGGARKALLGGAFVAALAVGGGAAYTYQYTDLFGGQQVAGGAPTIKASVSPVKIVKQKTADSGKAPGMAVHSRLGGAGDANASADGREEKLAASPLNAAKTAGETLATARSGMLSGMGSARRNVTRQPNAPRRVKTLIVRPDGTILRPAGGAGAPRNGGADATRLAVGPGINAAAIPRSQEVTKTAGNEIRRMKTVAEASNARRLATSSGRDATKPANNAKTRPALQKTQKVKATALKAVPVRKPALPRTAAAPAPRGDIGTPFVVQVTSRSSQTGALAAFADMQQKYPSLIGGFSPDIQRADLGAKGIWYRLRVGPVESKTAATDLCSSLKQAGHPGCFVRRK